MINETMTKQERLQAAISLDFVIDRGSSHAKSHTARPLMPERSFPL